MTSSHRLKAPPFRFLYSSITEPVIGRWSEAILERRLMWTFARTKVS